MDEDCKRYLNTEAYPHFDFIKDLKQEVKKGCKSDCSGLINVDLKNIIKAWDDRYIKREDKGHFSNMKQYQQNYNEKGKNLEKDLDGDKKGRLSFGKYVLRDKRTWILSCRLKYEQARREYVRQQDNDYQDQRLVSSRNSGERPGRPLAPSVEL